MNRKRENTQIIRSKKRHRRKYRREKLIVTILLFVCCAGIFMIGKTLAQRLAGAVFQVPFFEGNEAYAGDVISTGAVDLGHLNSRYAILTDSETGNIIGENRGQERIYPASLTKIMTAVIAVENTADLDEHITMPSDIYDRLYAEDASMAGFLPGEEVRLRDLLYGVLLPSGAECCLTFAQRIAGSEEAFVDIMNQKAQELGMENTHFSNSTGLQEEDHYSTVGDIALLLQYALKNEDFRSAFTSSRYSIPPTSQHPDGFTFHSTMFQYMQSAQVPGGEIIGGKTGYTQEAGLCLASAADVNGREYILVTAKAEGSHETEQFHITDAVNVYSQLGDTV
ncbi:MAG: serine hydrolase [Eubacteriales bacterium]|nr:serine hydrolase [Eubacteriales bacterium]